MTSKHTPGPWHLDPHTQSDVWARGHSYPSHIADVASGNPADARLIAAAPDMLAALRELAGFMGITGDREGQRRGPMADNVRAILSRIDGEA